MSFELTVNFTQDISPEIEVFETHADALNFAKRLYRDGYVKEDGGVTTFYPSNILSSMQVQESTSPVPDRPLGHGL